MTFHHKSRRPLRWLVAAGVLTALALPTAANAKPVPADTTQYVVVNGDRVPLSQLSQYQQASAGRNWGSQQVQIGGQLVRPDQLSAWQGSAARSSGLVQIGGQLVSASQLSTWQARAHQAPLPSQLVQIGGRLVQPSQVSSYQSQLGSSTGTVSTSSGGGFNWSALSGGLGGFVLLVGASAYVLRSRRRIVTTA